MSTKPGQSNYGNCDGVYHQVNKKAFGDWFKRGGDVALVYNKNFNEWACVPTTSCNSKTDCSNLANSHSGSASSWSGKSYEGDLGKVKWSGKIIKPDSGKMPVYKGGTITISSPGYYSSCNGVYH